MRFGPAFDPDSRLVSALAPSPNFGERRDGKRPEMILLHYTGMADARAALDQLVKPESQVSCHYVVLEDGLILQLVPEAARAWHAGFSRWHRETDINSVSIGVEIVNRGHDFDYPDFPDNQIAAVIALCADIASRWPIAPDRVLAHSDVAPRRKIDPGEKFPWEALHRAGVGHYVPPAPVVPGARLAIGDESAAVADLQGALAAYGYGLDITGVFGEETRLVTQAFQRHFRPALVDGVADRSTIATLRALSETRSGA